ncbi:DUF4198 domain-containing protein [Roseateles sp. DC23W]|uniref:DUF4198 domain-containing protein n=1 Tax=Pelomonas dachongensis TaxID=3299029 RepID=A0ABW7EHF0_9BURK
MKLKHITAAIAIAAALLPGAAQAHRGWLLPSATVLSGNEPWVTVDAAISNDLFYFEHNAMGLDNLVVFNPDGSKGTHENAGKGRYRSTFDVKLSQPGTYKIAVVNNGANASFKVDGAQKRVRAATLEALAAQIPANAQEVSVSVAASRNEIFVTSGKPTAKVLAPTGVGLELVPITHPNDLIAGETAQFRFVLDGKPAANLAITVIPGGIRYRDKLGEMKLTSDAEGKVSIKWPEAGMYWLNAAPARDADAPRGGPGGTLEKPARRASYVTTLEVLAQ